MPGSKLHLGLQTYAYHGGSTCSFPMPIDCKNVTKRFGGLAALSNVSFTVEKGESVGLIGPNGSGKTTLFNCISGFYRADKGKITFYGKEITRLGPHAACKLGISRTF